MIYSFEELNKEFKEVNYIKKNFSNNYRYNPLDNFLNWLWQHTKSSAKLRKIEHTIYVQDLYSLYKKQNGLCSLSGIKLTYTKRKNTRINPYNISVDRIDSSKGYIKDNIQLVCSQVNLMKSDISNLELLELCKAIVNNNV